MMEVTSSIVGQKLKEFKTSVDQRKINNYAAAVNDLNPLYLDDRLSSGLLAPPTLPAAITWPLINNIYEYIDLAYPPEVLLRLVHYSEHLEIHQPLRPGCQVTINGEVAAVLPGSKGTHVIFKLPAYNEHGEALFTEYIGGLLRGVNCADSGRGSENLPKHPQGDQTESSIWETAIPITRAACYIYEGCADVPFPIHTSPAFAQSVGLPDIIYFGVATLAQAVRELVNRENNADPSTVSEVACRFRGMVLPETFIRVQLTGRTINKERKELFFRVLNHEGREAVSEGYLKIAHTIES